jgi:hypothetical protein
MALFSGEHPTALHILEGEGLLHSERGLCTIKARAGGLYGVPEAEYRRLGVSAHDELRTGAQPGRASAEEAE